MQVYVELVLFNNFAVDAALMIATLTARRKRIYKTRVFIAACVGAALATAYAVSPTAVKILLKVLLCPLLVGIFAKPEGGTTGKKAGDIVATLLVFALFTYLTGGVVYGLSALLEIDVNSYAALGGIALAVAVTLLVARALADRRVRRRQTCKATVVAGEHRFDAQALMDSGNLLVDSVSGLPVVMLSARAEQALDMPAEGFIEVQTVSGQSSLKLICLDFVEIGGKDFKALGACTSKDFADYDIILQNSMF